MQASNAKRKKFLSQNIVRLILILFTLVVLLPILWTIMTSFKTSSEFLQNPWALPSSFYIQNYFNAFEDANIASYFLNSFYVTVLGILFVIVLAVPTAYVTSRFRFRLAGPIALLFMAGLFVSQNYIVVPIFLVLTKLGLLQNLSVLALVYAVCALPFSIYLLSGFLRTIPRDYEEAAQIDGCGYFSTLFRVIVPIAKPAMVTVVMFNFMSFWNEYILALTVLDRDKTTLSVGLLNLMEVQKFATDWGAMFAGLVIAMLPTMIVYVFVQGKLTQGISMGGLKG